MKSKVVPLRIPENLDELAALSALEQHSDKATALRQWRYRGATQLSKLHGRVAQRTILKRGEEWREWMKT